MEAVAEMPDDTVTQLKPLCPKQWVQKCIDRHDLSVFDIVSDLPTDRTTII